MLLQATPGGASKSSYCRLEILVRLAWRWRMTGREWNYRPKRDLALRWWKHSLSRSKGELSLRRSKAAVEPFFVSQWPLNSGRAESGTRSACPFRGDALGAIEPSAAPL